MCPASMRIASRSGRVESIAGSSATARIQIARFGNVTGLNYARRVLGIDIGTGGTRALIVGEDGRILASATEEHEAFASPKIGWAEQGPEDWWRGDRHRRPKSPSTRAICAAIKFPA